jgi:hypothetical protein
MVHSPYVCIQESYSNHTIMIQVRIKSTLVTLAPPSSSILSSWLLISISHLHLVLYKYISKPLHLLTLLHPIIFLYATSSLILSHLELRNWYLQLFVSGNFSSIWMAFSILCTGDIILKYVKHIWRSQKTLKVYVLNKPTKSSYIMWQNSVTYMNGTPKLMHLCSIWYATRIFF